MNGERFGISVEYGFRHSMKQLCTLGLLAIALIPIGGRSATESSSVRASEPLVIKAQGSFFVGGEKKAVTLPGGGPIPTQTGDITVNQMYVQFEIPLEADRHMPVVMIHGCCLSSKLWETTPDGRMGWSEYFLRRGRSVYLAEQVSRARSGFDPTEIDNFRSGKKSATQMPLILEPTHQTAWTVFRFGPKLGEVFEDQQFPVQAIDEFYKQLIPDLNSTLHQKINPTWARVATLGAMLKGAAVIGHSEAGFFAEHAALIDPIGIKGIVSIESPCETDLTPEQMAGLAKVPTLMIFGDHLGDVMDGPAKSSGPASWLGVLSGCRVFVDRLRQAGGDARLMHLPALGIKGNSHMPMQDRNSIQIADLVIAWIDEHVERRIH